MRAGQNVDCGPQCTAKQFWSDHLNDKIARGPQHVVLALKSSAQARCILSKRGSVLQIRSELHGLSSSDHINLMSALPLTVLS